MIWQIEREEHAKNDNLKTLKNQNEIQCNSKYVCANVSTSATLPNSGSLHCDYIKCPK